MVFLVLFMEGALNMSGLDLFRNFIRALLRKWEFKGGFLSGLWTSVVGQ